MGFYFFAFVFKTAQTHLRTQMLLGIQMLKFTEVVESQIKLPWPLILFSLVPIFYISI